MVCASCGADVDEAAASCSECGEPALAASTSTAARGASGDIIPASPARGGFLRAPVALRRWHLLTLAAGALALTVLVAAVVAASGPGITQTDLDEAHAATARESARADRAEDEIDDAEADALEAATAKLAGETTALDKRRADEEAAAAQRKAELDAQAAAIAQREKAVAGAEAAKRANEFGDGVHEVGVDIQPGKYKTSGAASDCYWSKNRRDGGIIDNDLPGGDTTIVIEASVFTFKSGDCGTWRKVG